MDRKYLALAVFGAITVGFFGLAAVLSSSSGSGSSFFGTGTVAVVSLDGSITGSDSAGLGSPGITPQRVRDLNSRALQGGADAIIYEINSGGGAVVASKEIMREIESVEVPTVCRFRDVSASGAYLASLGCDRIVADSASITGSIGVRSSYMEFSGLMDKLGVDYVNITSGELKDVGSPFQNASREDRKVLQRKADIVHEDFIRQVSGERNLTESQIEEVRTGEIFLGVEAKELNLVDRLGGRQEALETAENLAGMQMEVKEIREKPTLSLFQLMGIESFFSSDSSPLLEAEY